MKKYLTGFLSGLGLGVLAASYFGPMYIAWYFEPPVEIGINCRPAVEWANTRLLWAQLVMGLVAGAVGVFIALKFGSRTAAPSKQE